MIVDVSVLVSVIQILLNAFPQPTTILTNLCWSNQKLIDFNRRLLNESVPVLVQHLRPELIRDFEYNNANQILILWSLTCGEDITQYTTQLNQKYRWLLIDPEDQINKVFETVPIYHSSQIFYISSLTEDSLEISSIYRNSPALPLIQETVLEGYFKDNTFKYLQEHQSIAIARQSSPGLAGTLINASLVITHNDSINHLTDYADKHLDTISKVNYALTNDVIRFLNGSVKYSIVTSWGYLNNETGHWDGMIGELVRGEAQIGASPLFFTEDRVATIQYLSMTSPTKSKFVFQAPKLSYTENVFLLPFGNVSV